MVEKLCVCVRERANQLEKCIDTHNRDENITNGLLLLKNLCPISSHVSTQFLVLALSLFHAIKSPLRFHSIHS